MAKRGGLGPAAITLIVVDVLLVAALVVIMVTWPNSSAASPEAGATTPAGGTAQSEEPTGGSEQTTSAPAVEVPEDALDLTSFVMPSGNIWCELTSDEAHCTIEKFDYSPPPMPDCDEDLAGHVWQVTAESADPTCPGGALEQPEGLTELGYGKATAAGDFVCLSNKQGVTCKSISTGHGFEIARDGTRTF